MRQLKIDELGGDHGKIIISYDIESVATASLVRRARWLSISLICSTTLQIACAAFRARRS